MLRNASQRWPWLIQNVDYGSSQESIMRIESSNIANALMKGIEGAKPEKMFA